VTFGNPATLSVGDVEAQNGVIHYTDTAVAQEPAQPSSDVVRVFVSSMGYSGKSLGGLDGADAECQQLADDASLGGTWTAWLSDDNTDAIDRIVDGRYELVDGTLVAEDLTDLTDGTLNAPINLSQSGIVTEVPVWTGTNTDGRKTLFDCRNWGGGGPGIDGGYARSSSSTFNWTFYKFSPICEAPFHLYCFETTS
jgi:hypothetical protein